MSTGSIALRLITSVLLACGFLASCALTDEAIKIEIQADENGDLVFRLTNQTEAPITLSNMDMPWNTLYPQALRIAVHGIGKNNGKVEVIEELLTVVSGEFVDIVLPAGRTIEEAIPLEIWFPEMGTADWASEFYLHWTYALDLCDLGIGQLNLGTAQRRNGSLTVLSQNTLTRPVANRCNYPE